MMTGTSDRHALTELLFTSTQAMFDEGRPLMQRVVPPGAPPEVFAHYPPGDVVNRQSGSRYFYHCHPPGARIEGEHGHFHIFFERSSMPAGTSPLIARPKPAARPKKKLADVVHIAALSISLEGLPIHWFTTNRWVTDEWVFRARDIVRELDRFDMRGAQKGDPHVNDWITALVGLAACDIAGLLEQRDAMLETDPEGDDRGREILSQAPIVLEALLDQG